MGRASLAVFSSAEGILLHCRGGWENRAAGVARRVGVAGRVGSGLRAEMGEIEIRARVVAGVHRLAELALGVEAVEHDGVNGDDHYVDDDFDDDTD